jgi:hypothetical protein
MRNDSGNRYEQAFESWLIDQRVEFVRAEDHRRPGSLGATVKSFDFLFHALNGKHVIAEVKGRTYKGTSLADLKGLDCWVTLDDVNGLHLWQQALGDDHVAVFIFAYRIAQVDVDCDGREAFSVGPDRYLFFAIRANDYRHCMRRRSPKWKTVTLSAQDFRKCVLNLADLLVNPAGPSMLLAGHSD